MKLIITLTLMLSAQAFGSNDQTYTADQLEVANIIFENCSVEAAEFLAQGPFTIIQAHHLTSQDPFNPLKVVDTYLFSVERRLPLPAQRTEFYEMAIDVITTQSLAPVPDRGDLREVRCSVLPLANHY